jgi:hypothetical protein
LLAVEQRVERSDPQPDEVGRWRELRLVADAPRRVEANRAGEEERAKVDRQVAGRPVIWRDDKRLAISEPLRIDQRRAEEGAKRGRDEDALARARRLADEPGQLLVLVRLCEQRSHVPTSVHAEQPDPMVRLVGWLGFRRARPATL